MEFLISNKELNEKLDLMNGIIQQKNSIESLSNVFIKVRNDKIILIGSNENMSIKEFIFTNNEINTDILINYNILKSIISKLCGEITSFNIDGNNCIISNEKSVYKLNIQDSSIYPNIEFKQYENSFDISTKEFKNIIKKTIFSCATSNKKPILTGTNLSFKNNKISCSSTDSYRLSNYSIESSLNNNLSITMPKETLSFIDKLIDTTNQESIKVLYDSKNIVIQLDNLLFKSNLLEGEYPDISRLLTQSCELKIKVKRNDLLSSLDRLSIIKESSGSDKKDLIVSLVTMTYNLNDKEMNLKTSDTEIGNANENIDVEDISKKNGFKISYNSKYMIDILKSFNSEYVILNLNNSYNPFIVTSDEENENMQILLPIRND